MRQSDPQWDQAKRILCVRLDNLGDVLMTTPAIRALKAAREDRHITLWASPSGHAVSGFVPEIDASFATDAPWMKVSRSDPIATANIVEYLRDGAYDAAVIFTVYSQSPLPAALMCHLAGIRLVLAHCRENPYHLLSHWVRETEPSDKVRHEAQRQLDLVARVGAYTDQMTLSLRTREHDAYTLALKLRAIGIAHARGHVLVHCGATAPSRRYPPGHFASVIEKLGKTHGPILLTGAQSEYALVADIASRAGPDAVNVAGRLTLGEMASLVEGAALLVSNNSGPVHMAAALGTPVAVLYALTNPQHTPWQVPHRVLNHDVACKNCYRSVCPHSHHACLSAVDPVDVVDAAYELLRANAGSVRSVRAPPPVIAAANN